MVVEVIGIQLVVDSAHEEVGIIREVEVTKGCEGMFRVLSGRMDEDFIPLVEQPYVEVLGADT